MDCLVLLHMVVDLSPNILHVDQFHNKHYKRRLLFCRQLEGAMEQSITHLPNWGTKNL